jgi:hypothetical protein
MEIMTSGSLFCKKTREISKACSKAPASIAYSIACSTSPNFTSSCVPASSPKETAQAYATYIIVQATYVDKSFFESIH